MRKDDFDFELPEELIAQAPLPERAGARMLVLWRAAAGGRLEDRRVKELPEFLAPGDVVVFNDTRVVPARLPARRPTGGRAEILLERALEGEEARVLLRPGKAMRPGTVLDTAAGPVRVLACEPEGMFRVALPGPALEVFARHGTVPLPPYIRRAAGAEDRERYQTVFAREPGSVAAPTASLHFDAGLLSEVAARGAQALWITLHVGAGTWRPVRTPDLAAHRMHPERAVVPASVCDAINAAHARGGRVFAVGTTVVRALESAALEAGSGDEAPGPTPAGSGGHGRRTRLAAWAGETRLFIAPGFTFRVVDGLLTNFHLPQSTLLMLVSAFAGRERVLAAYAHAVRERYRFFSYGDAMLLLPGSGA